MNYLQYLGYYIIYVLLVTVVIGYLIALVINRRTKRQKPGEVAWLLDMKDKQETRQWV